MYNTLTALYSYGNGYVIYDYSKKKIVFNSRSNTYLENDGIRCIDIIFRGEKNYGLLSRESDVFGKWFIVLDIMANKEVIKFEIK